MVAVADGSIDIYFEWTSIYFGRSSPGEGNRGSGPTTAKTSDQNLAMFARSLNQNDRAADPFAALFWPTDASTQPALQETNAEVERESDNPVTRFLRCRCDIR